MNSAEFIEALKLIEQENGIDREVVFEAIESSIISACKKNFGTSQNIKVDINKETGKVTVYAQKKVVEKPEDLFLEISLENAKKIKYSHQLNDVVDIEITPQNFGRISAQTAKQVVVQKFREAEREMLYNQYSNKEKDIMTGIVQRKERKNVIIALGKLDAVMHPNEQIPGEEYKFQDRLKVYVMEVKQTTKGPQVFVSRTHPELIKRLFEQEVPEIHDGLVEIKSIAREAGSRTKIAVFSRRENIDAIGACIGQNGYRINVILKELKGERIDIVNWNQDPQIFIKEALSPSKVLLVDLDEESRFAKVVVPDHQLSLSIGKEGQNVRLSAKLTGWKIDIKSLSQAKEMEYFKDYEF